MTAASLLACLPAHAGCPNSPDHIRKCYDNSNAPPAIVFKIFVQHLFADSLLPEQDQLGGTYVAAGLTSSMNSADVIHYFVSRYVEIENEVDELQKRTLCLDNKPRYAGTENLVLFNQRDEISFNTYEKYLMIAKSDLSVSGLFDIEKALKEFPVAFVVHSLDYEAIVDATKQQIYEAAAEFCEKPREHHFQSLRSLPDDDE